MISLAELKIRITQTASRSPPQQENSLKLDENASALAELKIQTPQHAIRDDRFRPTFHAPKNPSGVKINLDEPNALDVASLVTDTT